MQIQLENSDQKNKYLSVIRQSIEAGSLCAVKYLDFGVKVIRVLCYTPEIIPFLDQELTFVLKDQADRFDETIKVGRISDIKALFYQMDDKFNPSVNFRLRLEMMFSSRKYPDIEITDDAFPIIRGSVAGGVIEAYDTENHVCYYAVSDFEPEEFIKLGHVFVQQLNVLLKTPTVNLTHGAVFGYAGKGVLLCARGQRGKSTLTVHSLLNGCEYVSDDYQLLEKRADRVYSYPIYSIITLSPQMYQQMYAAFNGKFCFNNGRKDKYVFNISAYHDRFKTNYPIEVCLFPEIVPDKNPNITPCTSEEKARAIVQLIHSTVFQMRDLNDHNTIRKLFEMIKDLPFYKFCLCSNIAENTRYLKSFLNNKLPTIPSLKLNRMLLDITFDLANILDTDTFTLYSFNEFATNVYEMLLAGITPEELTAKVQSFSDENPNITKELNVLIEVLEQKNLKQVGSIKAPLRKELDIEVLKTCKYKLSLLEFNTQKTLELVKTEGK